MFNLDDGSCHLGSWILKTLLDLVILSFFSYTSPSCRVGVDCSASSLSQGTLSKYSTMASRHPFSTNTSIAGSTLSAALLAPAPRRRSTRGTWGDVLWARSTVRLRARGNTVAPECAAVSPRANLKWKALDEIFQAPILKRFH